MAIKRFIANDMRSALKQARSDLGTDVAIINTRNTQNGVELSAILDPKLPYLAANEESLFKPNLEQLHSQILVLQNLIVTHLNEFRFYQKKTNIVIQNLLRLGINFEIADRIAPNFTFSDNLDHAKKWRHTLIQLTSMLKIGELNYEMPLFFIGPSYNDTLKAICEVARYFLTEISLKPVIYAVNQTSDNLLQLKILGRNLQIKVIEHLPVAPNIGHLIIGEYSDIPDFANLIKVLPCVWQSNNLMQYCRQFPASNVIFTQFEKAGNLSAILNILLSQNNQLLGVTSPYFSKLKAHHIVSRACGLQFNNPANEHTIRNWFST